MYRKIDIITEKYRSASRSEQILSGIVESLNYLLEKRSLQTTSTEPFTNISLQTLCEFIEEDWDSLIQLSEDEINEVRLFFAGIIDAVHTDEISGEIHFTDMFRTTDESTGKSAYGRSSAFVGFPGISGIERTGKSEYMTEGRYYALQSEFLANIVIEDSNEFERKILAMNPQPGVDHLRMFLPICDDRFEARNIEESLLQSIESIQTELDYNFPLNYLIKRVEDITDKDSLSQIVSQIEDFLIFNNWRNSHDFLWYTIDQLREMINSDVLINYIKRQLIEFIKKIKSFYRYRGVINLPVRVRRDIIKVKQIYLNNYDQPQNLLQIHNVLGMPMQYTQTSTAEIWHRALGLETSIQVFKQTKPMSGGLSFIQIMSRLYQIYTDTKDMLSSHGATWRMQVLDRRMQSLFKPYLSTSRDNALSPKERELLVNERREELYDFYHEQYSRLGEISDLLLTQSGLSANYIAVVKAIKLVKNNGFKPKIYEISGWYFENKLNHDDSVDYECKNIAEANILLCSIDPNNPQIDGNQADYHSQSRQQVVEFVELAMDNPNEVFVVVFDTTSSLHNTIGIDWANLPKNLVIIITTSMTKHQRGRQNQFFGSLVQYGGTRVNTSTEEEIIGATLLDSSVYMYPRVTVEEAKSIDQIRRSQMIRLRDVAYEEYESMNVPPAFRWEIEVYNCYCYVIPPKVIRTLQEILKEGQLSGYLNQFYIQHLNAFPIRDAINNIISSYWSPNNQLISRPPVDKGDSFGTLTARSTVLEVSHRRMHFATVRIAAGLNIPIEEFMQFAQSFSSELVRYYLDNYQLYEQLSRTIES